jgi:diaminopimelate epimerase
MNFYKYHGAGNDFILLDQRTQPLITRTDTNSVAHLCHRRFGIGADGLILLQHHPDAGYEMIYFNSDGSESTLCGNGGRCFTAFARDLGLVGPDGWFRFMAIDGLHDARIIARPDTPAGGAWVELHMHDLSDIRLVDGTSWELNTGSPHYVRFVDHVADVEILDASRAIRYASPYVERGGINVNFVAPDTSSGALHIRTYERGVEDETLACGTGVTAAALAWATQHAFVPGIYELPVHAQGGDLMVRFTRHADGRFTDIWLCGPAQRVFEGFLEL